MQGRTYGSRVNQICCALRGKPLQRRELAECARFFPLLLGAGIVDGKGESACVTGGRCGARQDEDAAHCGYRPAISGHHHVARRAVLNNLLRLLFNGEEL
jgi:hypothetical protein